MTVETVPTKNERNSKAVGQIAKFHISRIFSERFDAEKVCAILEPQKLKYQEINTAPQTISDIKVIEFSGNISITSIPNVSSSSSGCQLMPLKLPLRTPVPKAFSSGATEGPLKQ